VLEKHQEGEPAKAVRSCKKLIRFTSAELVRVNESARALGQPVACYIREASLGAKRRPIPAVLSGAVIRDLARVATRLQVLRDGASAHGLPGAGDFAVAVDELLDLIRQID
jgi:hypothetical protein